MEGEDEDAPPPPLRRPTPDHPPYSEMVQCAIKTLGEPHGSTEPSISSFIQHHYDSLPWAHSKLLPYYLNKLILAGEIAENPHSPNRYVLPETLERLANPNPRDPSCCLLRGGDPKKHGRGRPRKVVPRHAHGEKVNCGENRNRWIVNPDPGILLGGPMVKAGRGRPRKTVENGGENRPKLAVNPNPSPGILWPNVQVRTGRGRCRKTNSHIDGEPSPKNGGKNERSFVANVNPSPNCLQVGSPVKRRGRPKKVAPLHLDGEANHDPHSLSLEPELNGSEERPRLVLKLKRRKPEEIGGDGGDVTGGWMCLKDEDTKEKESEGVKADEGNEEMLALQVRDLNAVEVDEHFEELLALQEKCLRGIKIDEHDEDFLALQEKDLDWMQIDGNNGDLLALQEKGLKGIKTDGQNEEMLALQEKDSDRMKTDGHNGDLLVTLENGLNGMKTDRQNEDKLVLQVNGLNGNEVDDHHKNVLSLEEKDLDEALQDEDLNAIQLDGCSGGLLAQEERDLKGTEIDEHNEESLVSKAIPNANSCQSKPDQGSSHKKARPKKTRRLWYEG